MKVAEVARRAGVGAHAVRFYVRAGLLQAARDPSNNYKQFGEPHVLRLRFIKSAQSLGFSLSEIRALLGRMDSGECTCAAMHLRLADKILELRRQIEELEGRHAFMRRVCDDWRAGADGPHDLGRLCRFLEQQAGQQSRSVEVETGRMTACEQPTAQVRAPRRTGKDASSSASPGRAMVMLPSEPRMLAGSPGRRPRAGRRLEAGPAELDLLSRAWRPAS